LSLLLSSLLAFSPRILGVDGEDIDFWLYKAK
jgi:hypothetical protein